MPNTANPQCTAATASGMSFQSYINTCLSTDEQSQANTLINPTTLSNIFDKEKAIQTDLITSLNGVKDLNSSGLKIVPSIEIGSLNTKLANINKEIKDNENQTEVNNQKFLQSITTAPKSTYLLANYQDVSLMFFFGSMIVFTIVVTIVQFSKKDGSLKGAATLFMTMVVVMLVTYGLLKEIA
jgi:predicted DNA binding CopG/RHH family protein